VRSPHAPGAGIAGAWNSLGSGSTKSFVAPAGFRFNDGRTLSAAALDRQADFWLSVGRHAAAERLAHLAAELRQGVRL
jgi:hypothetical protein